MRETKNIADSVNALKASVKEIHERDILAYKKIKALHDALNTKPVVNARV